MRPDNPFKPNLLRYTSNLAGGACHVVASATQVGTVFVQGHSENTKPASGGAGPEEEAHDLRIWETVAVYTFRWRMAYRRDGGPTREQGTDQLVLQQGPQGWQVAWRYICFQPADDAA